MKLELNEPGKGGGDILLKLITSGSISPAKVSEIRVE